MNGTAGRTTPHNVAIGRAGEAAAISYLVDRGMRVVDRNWRCADGEIDLVVADGRTAVFVEVKARTTLAAGHPLEAVTPRKVARLRRLAALWCAAHPAAKPAALRLDAVAVVIATDGSTAIEHVEGVA